MTSRRDFLRRTSLALAGGLIVGDAAMELFERLTHHRKSFPSASLFGNRIPGNRYEVWELKENGMYSHRIEYPSSKWGWDDIIHCADTSDVPFGPRPCDTRIRSVTLVSRVELPFDRSISYSVNDYTVSSGSTRL